MSVWQKQHGGIGGENVRDEGSKDTLSACSVFVGLLRKKLPGVVLTGGSETGLWGVELEVVSSGPDLLWRYMASDLLIFTGFEDRLSDSSVRRGTSP